MAHVPVQDVQRRQPDAHAERGEESEQEINRQFAAIDLEFFELKGQVEKLAAESAEDKRKLRFAGGRFEGEMVVRGNEREFEIDGEQSLEFSNGERLFLDFVFEPNDRTQGQMTLNVLGNVADKQPLEFSYGDRGRPITLLADTATLLGSGVEFTESQVTLKATISACCARRLTFRAWTSGIRRLRRALKSSARTRGTA